MKNKKLVLSFTVVLGLWALAANNAFATTWYVRDGGGTASQCTGTTNAVYPGSGTKQPCSFSNPMFVLGAGCGNTGFNTCDVPVMMQAGDTLNIVGDSDINPGQQAQFPIGYDANGIITPAHGNNCTAGGALNCTMGNMPNNSSIIGIGNYRPQLWGREHLNQVLNANGGNTVTINNLEITQHSSCVYNGVNPGGTTGGFPDACNRSTAPFGPWAIAGMSLTGTGITLENTWIHGMAQWGITTGSLTNFTEQNNVINGNGGGGVGLGQNYSNAGTMTLGGTTTVSNEIIVFNGCGEVYPIHSSNPFDTLNYYNCADDSSSNGTILADGWGMEAGSGVCNLVNMSNVIVSFNTKGGIDNLHCNGTGTFNITRSRMEGNESQQIKLNYGIVNMENSQIINDCNFFKGQLFTTKVDGDGNTPPSLGYDFCRAAGNGIRLATSGGGIYNISNSTFFSNGGANIELPPGGSCNSSTVVNINNNLVVGSSDYTNGNGQNTDFWENDTGTCNPVVENNNLVYEVHDPSHCAGSKDICNNPTNAGVNGNFALNGSYVFSGIDLADQFYPSINSPLIGAANTALTLNGTSNDYNNFARGTSSWDIGSYQHGSSVPNGGTCFLSGECSSGICSINACTGTNIPVVSIINPGNASTVTSGSNVTITVTAIETNGTISNISLYNAVGVLLGSSSSSPYNYVMTNIAAGTYTFYASAADSKGTSGTSNPITITSAAQSILPSSPVVAITSPTSGSSFTDGSNVTVTAAASETNGSINNLSIFNGAGVLLGSASSSPFSFVDTNLQAGTYTFTAQATDAFGVSVTSSPITITVASSPVVPSSPVIAITGPANGSSFSGISNITLTASASEANGSITQVQFFNGIYPLSYTGTSSPYSYVWKNVQPGTYTMTAQATDSNGVVVASVPVTISVNAATIPTPAPVPPSPPVVAITSPANGSSLTAGSNITITASASEVNGSISKVAFYNGSTLLGTATSSPYSFSLNNAAAGSYSLTAIATDANGVTVTSSPVLATVVHLTPDPSITSPANGSSFTAGSNITITAAASEVNGSISKVAFYNGSTLLGTATSSPYSFIWNNVAAGSFSLTAIATDPSGASATSSPITITVTTPPSPPVVAMTSPANASSFAAGANVTMTAAASEVNGSISSVAFYNGTTLLGTSTSSPYSFTWSNAAAGSYSLSAIVTDSRGVTSSSAAVNITVAAPVVQVKTVSILSPVNNATYSVPAGITLTASAVDSGDTILRVDYYAGTIFLGEATKSPFTVVWTSAQAGTYNLTAKATDSNGIPFLSKPVKITVNAHAAPTVSITTPLNNASYVSPSNLTITSNAIANGGSITKVDFYANGWMYLGTVYHSPYSLAWNNVRTGTYSVTAKATDTYGWSNTSAAVNIVVTNTAASSAKSSQKSG